VLKNLSIGHSSKNGFVDAFGLIGVQRACGGATKLARGQPLLQPLLQAGPPVLRHRRPRPRDPFHIAMRLRVFYITPAFDMPADAAAFLLRQSQAARRRGGGAVEGRSCRAGFYEIAKLYGCTAGVDVKHPLRIAALDASIGRILLKKSEIEPPRKSRFRGRRVISADSPGGRAYGSVAHGKTGRSADPLGNFSSRPPAVS
jgi:hypothetical protein